MVHQNVKFIKTDAILQCKGLYKNDIIYDNDGKDVVYQNIFLESTKIDETFTNYNSSHNTLPQTLDKIHSFLKKSSIDRIPQNAKVITEGVFIHLPGMAMNHMQHVMWSFLNLFPFFYTFLKRSPQIDIILDYNSLQQINEVNLALNKDMERCLLRLSQFIRDLNIINKIVVISNLVCLQNFKSHGIFIKKLHVAYFENKIYNDSRFIATERNVTQQNMINQNLKLHSKKYFILDLREGISRGLPVEVCSEITELCSQFCKDKNLELVKVQNIHHLHLMEQYSIAYQGEYFICVAGSSIFFQFNTTGKILILNCHFKNEMKQNTINHSLCCWRGLFTSKNKGVSIHYVDQSEIETLENNLEIKSIVSQFLCNDSKLQTLPYDYIIEKR